MTDYSDIPQSITEIRAIKEDDPSKWLPRDALIHALRKIDSGELNVEGILIVTRIKEENETYDTGLVRCRMNSIEAMGALAIAQNIVMNGEE